MMNKSYKELVWIPTFEERAEYLKLSGKVGEDTFGFDRIFNQMFYRSQEWQDIRSKVIARDLGCDLAIADREIFGKILVHHMNPIDVNDIRHSSDILLDPNYLICVSHETHNYIHYGRKRIEQTLPKERKPNDMCPWKQKGGSYG